MGSFKISRRGRKRSSGKIKPGEMVNGLRPQTKRQIKGNPPYVEILNEVKAYSHLKYL